MKVGIDIGLRFLCCGFQTTRDARWRHVSRPCSSFELFCVTEGQLFLADEYGDYALKPGDFLITAPCAKQRGTRGAACSCYWFHFENASDGMDEGGSLRQRANNREQGKQAIEDGEFKRY